MNKNKIQKFIDKREKLKSKVDDLMNKYDKEEIDAETYFNQMIDLTSSYQEQNRDE